MDLSFESLCTPVVGIVDRYDLIETQPVMIFDQLRNRFGLLEP